MSPINVLVIFYSRSGATETLALAAAVGAVQARASIRLRRLPDPDEAVSSSEEALVRMRKEYVPPAESDVKWADAIIIALNGTVAGTVTNPQDATSYGRRVVTDTRTAKSKL